MSTEDGSSLDLVPNEINGTDSNGCNTVPHEKLNVSVNDKQSKTILNSAFEEGTETDKEISNIEVIPSSSLDNLDTDDSDVSDGGEIKSAADNKNEPPQKTQREIVHNENKLKPPELQKELHKSASSGSIIIDEKETVEVFFKTDDVSDDGLDVAAELNISSAVTVQPSSNVSVRTHNEMNKLETADSKKITVSDPSTTEKTMEQPDPNHLHHDTDLDFYPLSSDEHRNCCYRCWYSETCNACIIGLIDRLPDKCMCPCLLSCYRCLQIVLCCDWS